MTDHGGISSNGARRPHGFGIVGTGVISALSAIDDGRAPSVTADDGRAALEVACAVYESARNGRTVRLPAAPRAGERPDPS